MYSNYYSFENDIWHADSSIVFNFNSNDATSLKFDLSVSYNNEYPFSLTAVTKKFLSYLNFSSAYFNEF